jgi:exodeoxyribonuclease-1
MTLLWYDLETFGRNPRYDRIAQFAAIRTDDRFVPMEEPVVLYGKLSPDYLPDPLACLITGITPQEANSKGLCEAELVRAIDVHLSRPGTCALGYNTIAFDDEFIRNLYYRNFHDPYKREWADGNSRWDILDLARAARDLRPEGIHWPVTEDGKPTVKLELLTQANHLSHEHAHDALSGRVRHHRRGQTDP